MKRKKYYLQNDEAVYAASAAEFVTELRLGSLFDSDCTDEEYMRNFAERHKVYSGHEVRTTSAEVFLSDLIKVGYVEKVQ
jgi:hypothetical protein